MKPAAMPASAAGSNRKAGQIMTEPTMIREMVAAFDSRQALDHAIEDLQSHGFDRSQLSLLASRSTVEQQLRYRLDDTHALKDDPNAPRTEPLARDDVNNAAAVAIGTPAALAALIAGGAAAALTGGVAGIAIAALAAGGGSARSAACSPRNTTSTSRPTCRRRSSAAASCFGSNCAIRRRKSRRDGCSRAMRKARSGRTTLPPELRLRLALRPVRVRAGHRPLPATVSVPRVR